MLTNQAPLERQKAGHTLSVQCSHCEDRGALAFFFLLLLLAHIQKHKITFSNETCLSKLNIFKGNFSS